MQMLKDYINGQWVEGSGSFMDVYNPSTGAVIAKVPVTTEDNVAKAIQAAAEAFQTWKEVPLQKRMGYLFKLRDALVNRKEELAQLISTDQAKHIADARAEVDIGLSVFIRTGFPCAVVDDHRKPSVCSHNGLVHLLLCCHFHHFLYSAACSAENFCSRKSISSMELGQPCEKPYFLPSRYRMMH